MKIDARRIEQVIANPGEFRAVLLFGEDEGLIREYAATLVRSVAGSINDPFRVTELERDTWSALRSEMAAMSLTGGRRVVRIRDATDAAAAFVQAALDVGGDTVLVLEGFGLTNKSKLKTLLEKSNVAGVFACYPMDKRALSQLAREVLGAYRVTIEPDALEWLVDHLGVDRGVSRSELEKLALYAGGSGAVDVEAIRHCIGDLSGLSLEDAAFAAISGDVAEADRALELAMAEGASPVGIIRVLAGQVQRMGRVFAQRADGLSLDEAIRSLRPPIFFRREPGFRRALQLWDVASIRAAMERMWSAELECKKTGSRGEIVCRNAVLLVAQRAAVIRRRG
jgi:DNA polymerase-3 subunit delta